MKLTILTKPSGVLNISFLKSTLRTLLGKAGGPAGVEESLRRGLKNTQEIECNFNPDTKNIYENVVVLQGVDTLVYALKLKSEAKIKNIFAGPNITMLPTEYDSILKNEGVNKILVPSNWVKDMYLANSPEIKDKIEVWPAGVENTHEESLKNDGIILYFKNAPRELLDYAIYVLKTKNINWNLLEYGKYSRQDYFNLLKIAKGAIFFSPSESQGLALQEAWIRNVPTLVWDSGVAKDKNLIWHSEKISAPYLTDESGIFFKDKQDFDEKINIFLSKKFEPKKYCTENLADNVSVKKLLEIINKNDKIN